MNGRSTLRKSHGLAVNVRTCGFVCLLLACSNTFYGNYAGATEQPVLYVEGQQHSIGFGTYTTGPIKTLDDLPDEIKAKLEAHLIKRLGQDYFRRLSVSGGQIVDLEELYRINPRAKNYQWKVFSYRIGFRISAPEKGIRQFNGYIELDRNGDLLKDIEFPAVTKAPWKGNFVSFESALKTAEKFGMIAISSQIKYSSRKDVLMFVMQERIPRDTVSGNIRVISINAHTGELISDDMGLYIK